MGTGLDEVILTKAWFETFCDCWNRFSDEIDRSGLAGAGAVEFIVAANDTKCVRVILVWDIAGYVRLSSEQGDKRTFSAPKAVWIAFLGGRISASMSVLMGKIAYVGPIGFALKFGPRFDRISRLCIEHNLV
jgi:putative sterol carrier protein